MTANTITQDPRHTFLSAKEVIARYGWGRTKGYQMLASPGFPLPIGGKYRLDTLMAWEDAQLAGNAEPQPQAQQQSPAAAIPTIPPARKGGRPRKTRNDEQEAA